MASASYGGGTGTKLTSATVIVAAVACAVASVLSLVSIWLQLKNYRKPLLQRYVVRILIIVPIYCAASWISLYSLTAAFWIDPIHDLYEAFTIYTFLQLLINFLGGERALIIMMHGRPPVQHLWPLNQCLPKVDISDPHTFLAIKRGILQYTWIKPFLSIAIIAMKATNTYQEGYVGLQSGYLWSGLIYNISITLSLYALGMFWVCMSQDLQPFRPMPKFLCIKLIIFASYWQGFFLSILVWLRAIPDDVTGYTPDNIAAAIQNALICFEMPAFAVGHWYAFSWHDYADISISAARLPVLYAMRDAFGCRDLIEDTKETFGGKMYEYRVFDSGDNVLAHEDSVSRVARMMEGMRYERGGKGKYWLPKPGDPTSRTPLLAETGGTPGRSMDPLTHTTPGRDHMVKITNDVEHTVLDDEDERLFLNARALEFGDWNYPVITAHEASREEWMHNEPETITTATNRNFFQPTKANKARRKRDVQKKASDKGKHRGSGDSEDKPQSLKSKMQGFFGHQPVASSSSSIKSQESQRVDLVVEDTEAEETERVRARKEGSSRWNESEPKHFVKTYPGSNKGKEVREGFDPSDLPAEENHQSHGESSSASAEGKQGRGPNEIDSDDGDEHDRDPRHVSYGNIDEERDVWK